VSDVWTVILTCVCSRWPLEMHMVHYDRRFKKFSEAAKVNKGLAVLAVLFYVSYITECLQVECISKIISYFNTNNTYIFYKWVSGIPKYAKPLSMHLWQANTFLQNTVCITLIFFHCSYIPHTSTPYSIPAETNILTCWYNLHLAWGNANSLHIFYSFVAYLTKLSTAQNIQH
jgi:hypothetical protein